MEFFSFSQNESSQNCTFVQLVHLANIMKNILPAVFLIYILALVFSSCAEKEKPVMCTMEFRTVSIIVNGDPLDEFFTIRLKTNDTLRLSSDNLIDPNTYPVLDDSFQKILEGKTEEFRFLGFKNNVMVVNEPFVIRADKCHIEYVSGKKETEY